MRYGWRAYPPRRTRYLILTDVFDMKRDSNGTPGISTIQGYSFSGMPRQIKTPNVFGLETPRAGCDATGARRNVCQNPYIMSRSRQQTYLSQAALTLASTRPSSYRCRQHMTLNLEDLVGKISSPPLTGSVSPSSALLESPADGYTLGCLISECPYLPKRRAMRRHFGRGEGTRDAVADVKAGRHSGTRRGARPPPGHPRRGVKRGESLHFA
jgi:hypothetical protein